MRLKIGDNVEIILRKQYSVSATGVIGDIDVSNTKQITVNNLTFVGITTQGFLETEIHDLRRVLNKATSTVTPIQYGNNVVTSDIQNVYNELDDNFYVASNSLPSYNINAVSYTHLRAHET